MNQKDLLTSLLKRNLPSHMTKNELYTEFIVNSNATILKNIIPSSTKGFDEIKSVYISFLRNSTVNISKARRGERTCRFNEIKTEELCSTIDHYLSQMVYTDEELKKFFKALDRIYFKGLQGVKPEYNSSSNITGIKIKLLYMGVKESSSIKVKLTLENESLAYKYTSEGVLSFNAKLGQEIEVELPSIQTAPEQCSMDLTIEMFYDNNSVIDKTFVDSISIR